MILMPQIFDVTVNENARYKRNELEFYVCIASLSSLNAWYIVLYNLCSPVMEEIKTIHLFIHSFIPGGCFTLILYSSYSFC